MQQIDITAKLLANENIHIIRDSVPTASFSPESRELILPNWSNTSPEIDSMLVGHEVGHALYSTMDLMDEISKNPKIQQYINIVEDVRIEKLIKRKYPGIRKTLAEGYKQLNERDFFGVKQIPDLNSLNLIDRINLYSKVGMNTGIQFNSMEMKFVNRLNETETTQDVIELAQEIYDFAKQQMENQTQKSEEVEYQDDSEEESDEFESEEGTGDNYDEEESEEESEESEETNTGTSGSRTSSRNQSDDKLEEELESITSQAADKNLKDMADTSTVYQYYDIESDYDSSMIISYKTVLQETSDSDMYGYESDSEKFNNFKTSTNRSVNYLVKEFEMKKSAEAYRRTQIAKSGSLDMNKVWGYKLNEDLFKKVAITKNGKNHGMLFLLDWSSSMSPMIQNTIEQVIQLVTFCRRIQIPFQVMAFTNNYSNDWYTRSENSQRNMKAKNFISTGNGEYCVMLELFSHKMTNSEFTTMERRLYNSRRFRMNRHYGLGGTPLNTALVFCLNYVGKFIKMNNVEKMSFVTLTDGQSSELTANNLTGFYSSTYTSTGSQLCKHFIKDSITKKNYEVNISAAMQTGTLLQMIKDRYQTTNLGFFITQKENDRTSAEILMSHNLNWKNSILREEITKTLRKEGFYPLKTYGRDELFVISGNSLKIKETEYEVSSKQSSTAIAKRFGKMMGNISVNRPLLNKFINYVS